MAIESVWHKGFGVGSVISKCADYVLVDFENIGEKKISNSVWGTILFFSIEDFKEFDKQKIKEKYSGYLTKPIMLESKKDILDNILFTGDYSNCFKSPAVDEKMLFNDFGGITKRNIVIILCQNIKNENKMFLRIIGIDIFTGKTINIVDTNGSEYGFHSYNSEFAKLPEQTVIQADFKMFTNEFHLNTLRIVGPILVLGRGNVPKLKEKYERIYPNISGFIHSFDDVFEFCSSRKSSRSYFIVNFTGSMVQPYKERYQLKMSKYFVDIRDLLFDSKSNGNKFYHGWTILQCDIDAKGKHRFSAQRLIGKFLTEQEFEEYKEHRKAGHCNQDDYLLYENESLEIVDSFEYDEEYEVHENEYGKELNGAYNEYAGELLDEYSEYYENWDEEGDCDEDKL